MSNIITIAYTTEGTTDQRFLHNIIRKTFEELALNCLGQIEVYEPVFIKFEKQNGFIEDVIRLASQAFKIGINVLCIHVDADDVNEQEVLNNKIMPVINTVNNLQSNKICKNLVAVIPVHMSEAWMLADRDLLKEEIGTDKSDEELELTRHPEIIADPKQTIENILHIAQNHLPKRRNRVTITDLYQPIGQKISIEKLEALASFKKFKSAVEEVLKKLNYL